MSKFCPNCGAATAGEGAECAVCGSSLPQPCGGATAAASILANKKSSGLTVLLSVLVPGLGHMYLGKGLAGAALLASSAAILATGWFLVLPEIWLAAVPVWLYGIYDGYQKCKRYNTYLLMNDGRTPW